MDAEKIKKIYAGLYIALEQGGYIEDPPGVPGARFSLLGNGVVLCKLAKMVGAELSDADRKYVTANCDEIFGKY